MKSVRLIGIAVVLSTLLFISCQREKTSAKNILARVDDHTITAEQFQIYYELDPNFGVDSSGYPALKDELNQLILEIKAKKKAQSTGMLQDPVFKRAIRWERKQATLRALYRREIGSNIVIKESELRKFFRDLQEQVHVRHLFTKNKDQAEAWYKKLKSGRETFYSLAKIAFKDSVLRKNGGDLGWVPINGLDKKFIAGFDTLKKNEISRPVETHWGFHIIELLNRKHPQIITETEFQQQKEALKKRLRQIKGKVLARKYVSNYFRNINPQPNPTIFSRLWKVIVPSASVENPEAAQSIMFSNYLIAKIRQIIPQYLDKPLIRYVGGFISLGQYLKALNEQPISQRPRFRTARQLSDQMAVWFRDNYLFRQAQNMNLDEDPQVKEEVERTSEEQIYNYYLSAVLDTIKTPYEIKEYFSKHSKTMKKLSRFHTLQEWQWDQAQHILNRNLKKIPANIFINTNLLQQINKKVNWDRRIRMFMIRKPS